MGACVNLREPTKAEKTTFYTLEYSPPAPSDFQPLSVALRVQRFSVAPTYDTNRIIYRVGSFERDAYFYHKWRDNPGGLTSYFLSRDMRESELFEAVLSHDSRVPASHILGGRVDEFLEWDTEDVWEAILSISIVLTAVDDMEVGRRPLFQKSYHMRETCKRKTPKALAEAMSYAMSGASAKIIKDIYRYLNQIKDGTD
jgi:cholesterol transport system auxiliary component